MRVLSFLSFFSISELEVHFQGWIRHHHLNLNKSLEKNERPNSTHIKFSPKEMNQKRNGAHEI